MPRYKITNHMPPGVKFATPDGIVATDHNGHATCSEAQAQFLRNSNDVVEIDDAGKPKRAKAPVA